MTVSGCEDVCLLSAHYTYQMALLFRSQCLVDGVVVLIQHVKLLKKDIQIRSVSEFDWFWKIFTVQIQQASVKQIEPFAMELCIMPKMVLSVA